MSGCRVLDHSLWRDGQAQTTYRVDTSGNASEGKPYDPARGAGPHAAEESGSSGEKARGALSGALNMIDLQLLEAGFLFLTCKNAPVHRVSIGWSYAVRARPIQAAVASAASFAVGALLPLTAMALAPEAALIAWVSGRSLAFLTSLGAIAARVGDAGAPVGAWWVTFWGAMAMANDGRRGWAV